MTVSGLNLFSLIFFLFPFSRSVQVSFNWLSDEVHLGLGESEKSRRKKKKRPAASHWTGLDGLENSVFFSMNSGFGSFSGASGGQ